MFLDPSKPYILLPNEFQMFSQDELKLDRKVELYDPVRKKFELFVDTTDVGNILLFGLAEFMKYYRDFVSGNDIEHGLVNESVVSGILDNADFSVIPDNVSHISDDRLTVLDKSRKRYLLTNETAIYWPCSIRWTGRSNFECYLVCGWKTFYKGNGLATSDGIKFVIDDDKKNTIHVVKA
ncbi:hypothetical protein DEO72_LG5g1337 [Vigna unguiculata]|uniref:TF-B3 domain-containing protein n=1 Tax=Vigna unguiculata TaxID=3917 RepID=A0A4D6LX56_VIGUN|nr:hypothetical protein DEO72_LG5g1337 [Vigna unguiculata]